MHFIYSIAVLLQAFCLVAVFADTLGPSYPAPKDLTSRHSLVAASFKNLTSTLDAYLKDGKSKTLSRPLANITNITFSLGLFSLHDSEATKLQYHYTSPEIANAPNGTHKVDADTIYRVASVTKVFTVLTGLLELNSADWDRPLTDLLPPLKKFAKKNVGEKDPVYTVEWDKVAPNALAAQIAGVPRDGFPDASDLALQAIMQSMAGERPNPDPVQLGLPPVSHNNTFMYSPCFFSNASTCPPVPYIESSEARAPSFLPYTTPGYSNNGYSLLGLAIENITGKSFEKMFQEDIFEPLNMTSSSSVTPPKSEWHRSVIPGNISNFDVGSGVYITTGAILSTVNDMAKLGVGILNSTLLSSDQTRRWMKPFSHTADLKQSVGRPWEIHRYVHPSGIVTDIYTKSGDAGDYSAYFVLLPDFDAGFSILSSSSQITRFLTLSALMDVIINSLIPSLAAQAAAEAEHRFAGFYYSKDCSLNSSLTLTVNQSATAAPGLVIKSWISNGTDVLESLFTTIGSPPWRLLPSISDAAHRKLAFRFVTDLDAPSISPVADNKLFTNFPMADWVGVDSSAYGGIATTLFVFEGGENGTVYAVSPSAFQIELTKERK
ncbi:beta-lactamase/transpeptidase-like protein [Trichoderma chlorosporum]